MHRLPRHSHYKAALDDDEEFARRHLNGGPVETVRAPKIPLVGYTDLDSRVDNVYDAVVGLGEILIAVYSKTKSSRVGRNRAPRPETAYQRLKRQQKVQQLEQIMQRMTGGR